MNKKQLTIIAIVVVVLALIAILLGILLRDDPDIPPEPLPEASAGDAGVFLLEAGEAETPPDAEAGPSGKHPGGQDPRVSKLIACCRVVAQNAKNAGDPMTRASMMQASAVCESAARTGQYDAVDDVLKKYDVPCD